MEKVIIDINRYNELLEKEKEINKITNELNQTYKSLNEVIIKNGSFKYEAIVTLSKDKRLNVNINLDSNNTYLTNIDLNINRYYLQECLKDFDKYIEDFNKENIELQKQVEQKIIQYINSLPILKKLSLFR